LLLRLIAEGQKHFDAAQYGFAASLIAETWCVTVWEEKCRGLVAVWAAFADILPAVMAA